MATLREVRERQTREQMAIQQAWLDGKRVEVQFKGGSTWQYIPVPSWDWINCDYRVQE